VSVDLADCHGHEAERDGDGDPVFERDAEVVSALDGGGSASPRPAFALLVIAIQLVAMTQYAQCHRPTCWAGYTGWE